MVSCLLYGHLTGKQSILILKQRIYLEGPICPTVRPISDGSSIGTLIFLILKPLGRLSPEYLNDEMNTESPFSRSFS